MRLLSFAVGDYASYGAVNGDGIVDLGRLLGEQYPTLGAVLRGGELHRGDARSARTSKPTISLAEIRYLPTVPDPEKIICIGINYGNRNAEYKDGAEAPKYPSVFMRTPGSLVGHLEPIINPPESEQLDYEGEIVLVIGKAGPPHRGSGCVAARRWARADERRLGARLAAPFEVQRDAGQELRALRQLRSVARHGRRDLGRRRELHLTTRVNGELRQDDTTANLIFPFARLIEYLSSFMRLTPGDLIATGTPTGAGARFDPPKYLRGGDTVEVHVPELGTLTQRGRRRGASGSAAMPFVILALVLLVLTVLPGLWVQSVMRRYREPANRYPRTGGQTARHLLDALGLRNVATEVTERGDHYDPLAKVVRLSADNFNGRSLTAVTIAAHEVGHALQDARGFGPLALAYAPRAMGGAHREGRRRHAAVVAARRSADTLAVSWV